MNSFCLCITIVSSLTISYPMLWYFFRLIFGIFFYGGILTIGWSSISLNYSGFGIGLISTGLTSFWFSCSLGCFGDASGGFGLATTWSSTFLASTFGFLYGFFSGFGPGCLSVCSTTESSFPVGSGFFGFELLLPPCTGPAWPYTLRVWP